jgi:hypothetical protein
MEDEPRTLAAGGEQGTETITGAQGLAVTDIDTSNEEVNALFVQTGEAFAESGEVLMAGMLEIMEVIGIVDDPLEVTFVIADGHLNAEPDGHSGGQTFFRIHS